MGHLFSRAFKRITQGGQSRSPSNQSQQRIEQQDLRDKSDNRDQPDLGGPSEAIAVGQSIDSAEYAALETNNTNNDDSRDEDKENASKSKEENTVAQAATAAAAAGTPTANGANDKDKQEVEEAVIKIQALVRGHLARKALKDAHQHSVPPANALGQSQFDEDSLIKNPPSAIFSSASPSNLAGDNQARTPLASIAELTETAGNRLEAGPAAPASSQTSASGRKKLVAISARKTPSPSTLEVGGGSGDSRGSSPAPSHASIDLGGGHDVPTCFSASIDILDHNLKPTDRFAAVLHHREEPPKNVSPQPPSSLPSARQAPPTISTPDDDRAEGRPTAAAAAADEARVTMPAGTPDSLASIESEEAAAVRIQSAFRGYRTRKNSPYRTRSPSNNSNANSPLPAQAASQGPLQPEPAAVTDDDNGSDKRATDTTETLGSATQRQSRPRQASGGAELEAVEEQVSVNQGDEEVITTTEASEETVTQLALPHPMKAVESTASEAAKADAALQSQQDESTVSHSLDGAGQSEANASMSISDEPAGLSSALETGPQSGYSSLDAGARHAAGGGAATSPASLAALKQPSASTAMIDSRASIDTDSSILGAALSLNEADISVAEQSNIVQPAAQRASVPTVPMLEQIDEDKSLGVSMASEQLELEAKKLVEEMTAGDDDSRDRRQSKSTADECALEEATNELEEALEEAIEQGHGDGAAEAENSLLLSSRIGDEQLTQLELESDEIERRDPSGHLGDSLAVETSGDALAGSGGSSLGGSSSDEDDDNNKGHQKSHQHQQQQQQSQQAGAKNRKKNRNKRKGKK